ncbi:hypothetical protein [Moorena producens]|nr:hypothetical protein [Moorena producens]
MVPVCEECHKQCYLPGNWEDKDEQGIWLSHSTSEFANRILLTMNYLSK